MGNSDDEFLFISRKEHEGVEKIHGFQTKKYTTIFETMKNRIKIDHKKTIDIWNEYIKINQKLIKK